MAELTPMMKQYFEIKKQYEDCILFYRLGDFYEMFFDDALTASKELEITLTGRDCGQEERAPMCGVPYHACDGYLNKLIEKGYKVAICEQVEDPKAAKGIVKRDVIRIVTPGTNISTQNLDEGKNNYLMTLFANDGVFGIAVVDITTGDFRTTEVMGIQKVIDEINKFQPSELVYNEAFLKEDFDITYYHEQMGISISSLAAHYFTEENCKEQLFRHFKVKSLEGLGLIDTPFAMLACGATLQYLTETQKNNLSHLLHITPYITEQYMLIDSSTRRNLELTETLRDKKKRGSLLWVLDKTKTAMGARLLRSFIEQPLINKQSLELRYDTVEELNGKMMLREELREYLNSIYDLERLMSRVSYKTANPRDLIAFRNSMEVLPHIAGLLREFEHGYFPMMQEKLDTLEDLYHLIDSAIVEEPSLAVKEGGIIKDGFSDELDVLKKAKTDGKQWLADYEASEREKTGIKNLRIKFNKVFGYYLEVTKSYQALVPDYYIRKQTLTNAERYTTEELNKLANTIMGAEEKLYSMEYELFCTVRDTLAGEMDRVQTTAHQIAGLDVYASLAYVADHNRFVRPSLNEEGVLDIKDGRHPVVEKMIPNDAFIVNDTYLDNDDSRIAIITGPNMAGKSTYMRQTALIVLMAQAGSFVPAASARLPIVDRIFTRVGASDDLASGQSTFMVEMSEVANILRNATEKSLLVLDEIGRGTSTFDGLSIAWAVVEYISNRKLLGAKALFATHYHELTELEGRLDGVHNYCISVQEEGEDIVFLRKIKAGGADKSYGIQVARLAGVPELVLMRAREIADQLSDNDVAVQTDKITINQALQTMNKEEERQLSLFDFSGPNPVVERIKALDIDNMTPMQALKVLSELKKEV